MKKLLGILVLGLLLCNIGHAEYLYERLETEEHDGGYIQKICIDGYIFIRTGFYDSSFRTTQFTQFFIEKDGKSLPAKC